MSKSYRGCFRMIFRAESRRAPKRSPRWPAVSRCLSRKGRAGTTSWVRCSCGVPFCLSFCRCFAPSRGARKGPMRLRARLASRVALSTAVIRAVAARRGLGGLPDYCGGTIAAGWPLVKRIGRRSGPCTCSALRGGHGSWLASSKFFSRSMMSVSATRASSRASGAPRQK